MSGIPLNGNPVPSDDSHLGNGYKIDVDSKQRHTAANPCPICRGHEHVRRGQGERCYGFITSDGRFCHCSREDHAGTSAINPGSNCYVHKLKGACACGVEHAPGDDGDLVTYDYQDESGALLFQAVRFTNPKAFRQRKPKPGGGYEWSLKGVRRVLYRLPQLLAALAANPEQFLLFLEGEKDVDNCCARGFAATCNPMGAGKFRAEFAPVAKGHDAVILVDNDDPGRAHGLDVARKLWGHARTIRIVELPGLAEHGDVSDWFAKGGTREALLALIEAAPLWTPSSKVATTPPPKPKAIIEAPTKVEPSKPKTPRPSIEINTERHRVLKETLAAITGDQYLYCRGGVLSRLDVHTKDEATLTGGVKVRQVEGSTRIVPLTEAVLSCRLTELIDFYSWTKTNGEDIAKAVHPPSWLVRAILEYGNYPKLRQLDAVAEVPFPKADGSLVTTPGYDHETFTYLAPSITAVDVPDRPTQADATRAAEYLLDLVSQFPFVSRADAAVWLAALVTAIARPCIRGPVPGIVFNGNRAGTGKGKLIDIVGVIVTGRGVPTTTYPEENDEWRKVKTAFALDGTTIIHLDNLDDGRMYGGGVIDSAITSMTVNDRILGFSKTTSGLALRALWLISGNNVQPRKDAFRRWLVCRLSTLLECPEERDDIKILNLLAHVREHRTELVRAVLIMLRAHALAGRPSGGWAPLGSFEEWDQVVRGAVFFATGLDCNETRKTVAKESTDRLSKLAMLEAWAELPAGKLAPWGHTAEEAHAMAFVKDPVTGKVSHPLLAAAIMRFSRDGREVPANKIGYILRGMKGQTFEGLALMTENRKENSTLWYVSEVYPKPPKTGDEGDEGHGQHSPANSVDRNSHVITCSERASQNGDRLETSPVCPASPAAPPPFGCGILKCKRPDCPDCNP